MSTTNTKNSRRQSRHGRVRSKISGTSERPRIAVYKSNRFTYAQVIDDQTGKTLVSSSDYAGKKGKRAKGGKIDKALEIGQSLAAAMKQKGITEAVFDRGGFKYHGRVKALAEGLRTGGIKF